MDLISATEQKNNIGIRWVFLFVGTLCFVFAGIIYAWSILKMPLAAEFGWSAGDLATNYTITLSAFCLGCISGGILMRKFSPKIPVILGGICAFLGFFMTSRLSGESVVMLFLSYGVLCGFGIGVAYNTILATIGAWFPEKKGFASGCLMMGFGASTLVLGNVAGSLIESPDYGWRFVFAALGICTGIALVIMGAMIRLPAPGTQLPVARKAAAIRNEAFEVVDLTTSEMLRRRSFWMFFVAMLLIGAAGSSVISFAKDFAVSTGSSVATAGLYVGILAVFNGLGRIIAGIIFDRFGRKMCVFYVCTVTILGDILCLMAAVLSSPVLCLLGFCGVGLSYGGNTNVVSIMITAFYGNKHYAQNLSWGLLTLLPASFLAKFSTTLLTVSGGYVLPFALLTGYALISALVQFINKRP